MRRTNLLQKVIGLDCPFARFGNAGEGVSKFLKNLHRVVCRATVYYDVFDTQVCGGFAVADLGENTFERFLEKAPVVVIGGDNGESHDNWRLESFFAASW